MVFDDEFSTVPFNIEGTIHPNWTDLVQRSAHSRALDNIHLKNNWFTTNNKEYSRKLQYTSRT